MIIMWRRTFEIGRTLLPIIWTFMMMMPVLGDGNVITARCLSTCLSAHFTSSTLHTNSSSSLIEECSRNRNCTSCIFPCRKPAKSLDTCKIKCQEAVPAPDICIESCKYIKLIKNERIGECPAVDTIQGFGQACVQECTYDTDCGNMDKTKKCCSNDCGYTCQSPVITRKNYPPKIVRRAATVQENPDGMSATIRWSPISSEPGEVILYVIQGKNLTMARGDPKWFDIATVEGTEISVPLLVGRTYRFQVASVNRNGTLGFSRPTADFMLSRKPRKPSAPHSIESGISIRKHGKINMWLHWAPPKDSDLPISKYRVYYSERRDVSPRIVAVEEHRFDVPGENTSCELLGLVPGIRYFVQVMAIVRNGDTRLSSMRASKNIWTLEEDPRDNQHPGPLVPPKNGVVVNTSGVVVGAPPRALRGDEPEWRDGSLRLQLHWEKPRDTEGVERFTIHWEATVCSTEGEADISQAEATARGTSFELYSLSFDCTYEVWVRPVLDDEWVHAVATIQVLTPPCTEVISVGPPPPCPTSIPEIPSAPENLSYSYSIGETISVRFHWDPPTWSGDELIGYRIFWARVAPSSGLPDAGTPTIEREGFSSQHLGKHQGSYTITDLMAGSRYIVKVQALSLVGGGPTKAVDIETPRHLISGDKSGSSSAAPETPPPHENSAPTRSPSHSHAADRLVGSSLLFSLIAILCLCHVIQR